MAWGLAYLTDDLPQVHSLNAFWLRGDHDAEAREVADEADRVLGGAKLAHRRVVVEHEPLWERLTPGFEALGWRHETELYMVHRREPDRPRPEGVEVVEVDFETFAKVLDEALATYPDLGDPEVRRQLVERSRRYHATADERILAACADGRPVAWGKMRRVGDVVQLDDVETLQAHRRRGLARAVVHAALEAGRATDPELVFVIADNEDWPKDLYAKLGWEPVGRVRAFQRRLENPRG